MPVSRACEHFVEDGGTRLLAHFRANRFVQRENPARDANYFLAATATIACACSGCCDVMRMLALDAMVSVLKKKTPEKKHFLGTRTDGADDRGHVRVRQGAFARGDQRGRRPRAAPKIIAAKC
jgi:hypothetical protein